MTKVICAYTDCKYNSDKFVCKCKNISLASWNVATVNDGRRDFWECKNYEQSEEAAALASNFAQYIDRYSKK